MNKIFLTIISTLTISSLLMTMFLNSILGAFGMVATSFESFQKLKASQGIVQELIQRHEKKKINVSKNIVKRAGKKISVTTVAAATIGTVAVAAIITGLEIEDYCNEKKELHEEGQILFETSNEFNYKVCLEEAKADSIEIYNQLKESSFTAVSGAFKDSSEYTSHKWSVLVEEIKEKTSVALNASSSLVERAKELLSTDHAQ